MAKKKTSYQSRAVVTGAGSGIGRAFAIELAARGGCVVCSDIDGHRAQATVEQIASDGGKALAVTCDVSQLEQVKQLAEKSEQWLGKPVNLIINNAGVGVGGKRVEDISIEDWQWIMDINLWGVIYGCHVFTPILRKLGEGGIINVASAASFGAAPQMGAYNTTKAAVLALSETMAAELYGSGVKISVLCPTFVKTDIFKHARVPSSLNTLGEGLMNRTGQGPAQVAITTLNNFDKGKLHILPQTDAKISWMSKRLSPGLFTYGMGMVSRYFPK